MESLNDRILGVVKYNTGGPQRDTIAEHHIQSLMTYMPDPPTPEEVREAVESLVEEGKLEEIDGRYRLPP